MKLSTLLLTITFLFLALPAWPETTQPHGIKLDGSIGTAGSKILEGPEFHIPAELGEIKGQNLFHSFQSFNVHENENAIFYGPDSIQNVISRVTGNEHSWIDGGIQSMMPDADIFLFNPNGVFFGPNVFLDVQGSFHVSTCEYIGFSDQTKYDATTNVPLLTSSSPGSFGFIDNNFAQIQVQGKGLIIPKSDYQLLPSLYVKNDHTLSLIAGNIILKDGTIDSIKNFPIGTIVSDNGRVNIASVASIGEVILQTDGMDISSFDEMGDITISDHSVISASSGQVYIYGNHLKMNNSFINAGQYSSDGSTVEGCAGGSIDINVKQLTILDGSGIIIETFGTENSGDITIHSESILLNGINNDDNFSNISTNSISIDLIDQLNLKKKSDISTTNGQTYGDAGNINIYTGNLFLSDGAKIQANAFSRGNGGTILINASDTIDISGNLLETCGILAVSISDNENGGQAGDIQIKAKNLIIQNAGKIISSTGGTANAGEINIQVDNNLIIKSVDQNLDIEKPDYETISGIFSTTQSELKHYEKAGDAGNISLSGKSFLMEKYSIVNVSSNSSGKAGNIRMSFESVELDKYAGILSVSLLDGNSGFIFVQSENFVDLNNFSIIGVQSFGKGKPGGILIDTPKITIDNHSTISATSIHPDNTSDGIGVVIGRDIILYEEELDFEIHQICDQISIKRQSEILTESYGKGKAGVVLLMSKTIDLDEQSMVSSSSMKQGESGHSGEINLVGEKISLNNESIITTENAGMGNAGVIKILTDDLILDNASKIHSINTYGKDGGAAGMILVCSGVDHISPDDLPIIHPTGKISIKNHSGLSTSSLSEGGAGAIIVRAKDLVMSNSAFISAENKYPGFSDDIGIISIRGEKIYLSSESRISTQSESEADAGGIALEVSDLSLLDGSFVSSAGIHPDRKGAGGHIFIAKKITSIDNYIFGFLEIEDKYDAKDIFEVKEPVNTIIISDTSYISTSSAGKGDAGGMLIGGKNIFLSGGSRISSESTSPKGGGAAGLIKIEDLSYLSLIQDSKISTQAVNSSIPDIIIPDFIDQDRLNGMISITSNGDIHLFDGNISSSVLGGLGNGGNISILSKNTLLNRSQIIANAYEGNGGNINIISDYLIQSSDSIISASSKLGIDGEITIEALTENFDKQLISLPENFLNASKWVKTPCSLRDKDQKSHFIIKQKDALPTQHDDWIPTRLKALNSY